jgi:ribosomal protein S18 acetylase RimI-like enzyme
VTISITEASPQQAVLVHRVMQIAFSEYIGKLNPASPCHTETVDDVASAIRSGGAVLAWDGDEAVGSARFALTQDYFYVGRVSVLPEYRGMGVASGMMRYLENLAQSHGYSEMRLCSRLSLPRNIALYERLGFQIVHSEQISPDADVQVTMVKPLEMPVFEMEMAY